MEGNEALNTILAVDCRGDTGSVVLTKEVLYDTVAERARVVDTGTTGSTSVSSSLKYEGETSLPDKMSPIQLVI